MDGSQRPDARLFESLAVHDKLEPGVLRGIIGALLDSGSETFIRRALDRWGKDAVFGALDWVAAHGGKMSETCRGALTFHVPSVMDWGETTPSVSVGALVAVAHIVAPYSYQIAQRDAGVFHRAFQELKNAPNGKRRLTSLLSCSRWRLAMLRQTRWHFFPNASSRCMNSSAGNGCRMMPGSR